MTATAEIVVQKAEQALIVPTAALRFNPQAQKKRERKSSIFDALKPGPRFPRREKRMRQTDEDKGSQQVWLIGKGGQPEAVEIKTGLSDGSNTQILEGEIKTGDQVITAVDTDRRSS
jgi:HlyD family secretion protein